MSDTEVGFGQPQRVGRFRFFLDGQRWERSDAVARMHGYGPGTVEPNTELLLHHKHPDDRKRVAAVLEDVLKGKPFSSRHRIIDTAGHTRCVVVVGDRMLDDTGAVVGTSGFYVDVTESLHSDISTVLSQVAASRARIEQAKGVLMAPMASQRNGHSTSWSDVRKKPISSFEISLSVSCTLSPAKRRQTRSATSTTPCSPSNKGYGS